MRQARRWLPPLAVAALCFAAFFPAWHNGFVNWDDDVNLLSNPHYRGLGWAQLRWMASTPLWGHYQPLSWLTAAADYALWGMSASGYHLSNICLHCANAVLFYMLALRLLARPGSGEDGAGPRWAAGFAALFFACHPLRVEPVAWLAGRGDILAAFFFLAALLCYLEAARAADTRMAGRWRAASCACFLLSLLCKLSGWPLPIALLILDIYPLRRLPAARPASWLAPPYRGVLLEKVPFLCCCLLTLMLEFWAEGTGSSVVPLADYGTAPRLAQALFGPAFYLVKTLGPVGLSPLYERSFLLDPDPFLFGAVATLLLSVLFTLLRKRWPIGLAVWAYYLALLLPVLGLVKVGRAIAADRYTYLPGLGWFLILGTALSAAERSPGRCWLRAVAGAFLLTLVLATRRQIGIWHDSRSLWAQAVAVQPRSYFARFKLAESLHEAGQEQEARRQSQEAARTAYEMFTQAGTVLYLRGDYQGAARRFTQADKYRPLQ